MTPRDRIAAAVGTLANAGAVAWFGSAAYDALTHGAALAESMKAHRFMPAAAADVLSPAVAAVHLGVAGMALLGLCTRSLRPLGPLAMLAALTVFTAYLAGVWAWGDASAGCGCSGHAETPVPLAVMKNAVAGAAALGAFWATLPKKAAPRS